MKHSIILGGRAGLCSQKKYEKKYSLLQNIKLKWKWHTFHDWWSSIIIVVNIWCLQVSATMLRPTNRSVDQFVKPQNMIFILIAGQNISSVNTVDEQTSLKTIPMQSHKVENKMYSLNQCKYKENTHTYKLLHSLYTRMS